MKSLGSGNPFQLPEEARCHLQYLIRTYKELAAGPAARRPSINAVCDRTIADLERALEDATPLCWADLAQGEMCVLSVIYNSDLKERLSGWRRRLREVIGQQRYAAYLAEATPPGTTDPEALRSDLSQCIRTVYYFYEFNGLSTKSRTDTSRLLMQNSLLLLALFGAATLVVHAFNGPLVAQYVLAACATGVLGSWISVQRRLQDADVEIDPIYRHIQLRADTFSAVLFAPISGAVFAAVMYALLASGILNGSSGGIIPAFRNFVPDGTPGSAAPVLTLVYTFLAGFVEKFVPDILDRLVKKSEEAKTIAPEPATRISAERKEETTTIQVDGRTETTSRVLISPK